MPSSSVLPCSVRLPRSLLVCLSRRFINHVAAVAAAAAHSVRRNAAASLSRTKGVGRPMDSERHTTATCKPHLPSMPRTRNRIPRCVALATKNSYHSHLLTGRAKRHVLLFRVSVVPSIFFPYSLPPAREATFNQTCPAGIGRKQSFAEGREQRTLVIDIRNVAERRRLRGSNYM